MSGKSGKRITGRKPQTTRRHDSMATGAFGREGEANVRSGDLNRKISGRPSQKHSKYRVKGGAAAGTGEPAPIRK